MSYNTEFQSNNQELREILDTINELPDRNIVDEVILAIKDRATLGLHTDGLYYLFIDGSPVGYGISLPSGSIGDVVGNVDSGNNIVLNGNLPDGTYTVKYEMEDGSTVNIGDLVLDTRAYYSITNSLTNCTNSNSAKEIVEGESYSTTITADSGYELKTISVTMGGNAVSVSGGVINIASVTGNIVITAVAEISGPAYTNQIPISTDASGNLFVGTNGEKGYKTGYRLSLSGGGESAQSGYEVTGFIPAKNNDVIRIKNIDITQENNTNIIFYNSGKTTSVTSGNRGLSLYNLFVSNGTELNGVYTAKINQTLLNGLSDTNIAFIRIGSKEITDNSIITINQEIV